MYCTACGTLINQGLNYCSRCGARVDKIAPTEESPTGLEYVSMATGFVGLGGLGLTIGLIAILLNHNVVPTVIVILVLAFLCTVFGISFQLIQQLSKLIDASISPKGNYSEKSKPAELGAVNTAQLPEHREPLGSVTENTTRTLEKELVK